MKTILSVSCGALLVGAGWVGLQSNASAANELDLSTAANTEVTASAVLSASSMATAPTARPTASPGSAGLPPLQPVSKLKCVQFNSNSSSDCTDSGNFASKCAVATCGSGYTLTGGGGSCSAGDRKVKGLSPNLNAGTYGIMCEDQGVAPRAHAICCKL